MAAAKSQTIDLLVVPIGTTKSQLHFLLVHWAAAALNNGNDTSIVSHYVKATIKEHNAGVTSAASRLRQQKRAAFSDDSPDAAVKSNRGSGSRAAKRDSTIRRRMVRKQKECKWRRKDAAVNKRTKSRVASIMQKATEQARLARQNTYSTNDEDEEEELDSVAATNVTTAGSDDDWEELYSDCE